MFVPRQQYSRELKIATMRELDSGKSVGEVARTYQVSPKRLERWQGEWRDRGEQLAFPGHAAPTEPKVDAQRIPELERKMEIDFLKKSCGVSGAIPARRRQWRRRIYEEVQEASKAESAVNQLKGLCPSARRCFAQSHGCGPRANNWIAIANRCEILDGATSRPFRVSSAGGNSSTPTIID
jgi:transposase-like protein